MPEPPESRTLGTGGPSGTGRRGPRGELSGASRFRPPRPVRRIVEVLEEEGYETWTVGGAIRDALIGEEAEEWDLATRARPRQVRRLFPRTIPVGIDYGTVGVLDERGKLHEITTFRKDVRTFGRRAVVEFADSLEADLSRRDFTINAIAWHPLREELFDPFGGEDDLRARTLRTVGRPERRFAEDHLRLLRALRFAGRFHLKIEEATWGAIRSGAPNLASLSPERVREELMKILRAPGRPSAGLRLYESAGALPILYPEWVPLLRDGLWRRSLRMADLLPGRRPLLRLAALFHGVAEPAERTERAMTRLRFSKAEIRFVRRLVGAGLRPPPPAASEAELRRWLSRTGMDPLPSLVRLWIASARAGSGPASPDGAEVAASWRALRGVLASSPPLREGDLALTGADLIAMGLRPGPRLGAVLHRLLDRVLEDPALNERTALEDLARRWMEEGNNPGSGE